MYVIKTDTKNIPESSKLVKIVKDMKTKTRNAIVGFDIKWGIKNSLSSLIWLYSLFGIFTLDCEFNFLAISAFISGVFLISLNEIYLNELRKFSVISPIAIKKFLKIKITCLGFYLKLLLDFYNMILKQN